MVQGVGLGYSGPGSLATGFRGLSLSRRIHRHHNKRNACIASATTARFLNLQPGENAILESRGLSREGVRVPYRGPDPRYPSNSGGVYRSWHAFFGVYSFRRRVPVLKSGVSQISYPSHPYGSNVLPGQNVHYLAHGFLEDCCGFYAHFVWMRGPCRARELKLYEGGLRQA